MNRFSSRTVFAATGLAAFAGFVATAAAPARAQTQAPAAPGCVSVEVQNVRPGQGMVMIAAYGSAGGFNKQPLVATQVRAGAEATMQIPLCGLPAGGAASVALTLYQDLNGNGKLDANILGIPSEPWGASGTVRPMTAPTWDSAAVPVDGKTIVVALSK